MSSNDLSLCHLSIHISTPSFSFSVAPFYDAVSPLLFTSCLRSVGAPCWLNINRVDEELRLYGHATQSPQETAVRSPVSPEPKLCCPESAERLPDMEPDLDPDPDLQHQLLSRRAPAGAILSSECWPSVRDVSVARAGYQNR